jgi:RHS repeat-associated protein
MVKRILRAYWMAPAKDSENCSELRGSKASEFCSISAGGTSYNYDLTGNRNTGSNQVGPDNQLTADANWTYKYDPAGNLAEKDGKAGTQYANIVWKYGYDVFGNRVEEDVTKNGTTTVTKMAYDANGVCYADISSTGSIVTRRMYLDATDALFARITQAGGAVAWYLTDHLGSVTGLLNNSNTLIDGLVYDAFGNVTNETSPSNGDRYAFTGRERDVETGLQYNRARWYDPSTGRWITQDPLGFDAGDSNLYRYVNNQPEIATDPSGKIWRAPLPQTKKLYDNLELWFSSEKKVMLGSFDVRIVSQSGDPGDNTVAYAKSIFPGITVVHNPSEAIKVIDQGYKQFGRPVRVLLVTHGGANGDEFTIGEHAFIGKTTYGFSQLKGKVSRFEIVGCDTAIGVTNPQPGGKDVAKHILFSLADALSDQKTKAEVIGFNKDMHLWPGYTNFLPFIKLSAPSITMDASGKGYIVTGGSDEVHEFTPFNPPAPRAIPGLTQFPEPSIFETPPVPAFPGKNPYADYGPGGGATWESLMKKYKK